MSKIQSLSFDIEDAQKYGVDEAILLYNLRYWIRENKAREMNIKEGRVWSYNTYKAWAKLFPFWGEQKIRGILTSLEKQGAILTGNFHHNNRNRTKWYTTNDSDSIFICSPEQNPSVPQNRTLGSVPQNRTSLSYNTTNNTPHITTSFSNENENRVDRKDLLERKDGNILDELDLPMTEEELLAMLPPNLRALL